MLVALQLLAIALEAQGLEVALQLLVIVLEAPALEVALQLLVIVLKAAALQLAAIILEVVLQVLRRHSCWCNWVIVCPGGATARALVKVV